MRVHLGSDHAGLELKDHLVGWLREQGHEPVDHGPFVYDFIERFPAVATGRASQQQRDFAIRGRLL